MTITELTDIAGALATFLLACFALHWARRVQALERELDSLRRTNKAIWDKRDELLLAALRAAGPVDEARERIRQGARRTSGVIVPPGDKDGL